MKTDTTNINFQLACDFVQYTHRSIFLTGKAGTGKTTFLKYIKEISNKQIAVVAPTGVAAINAGGTTIHSFFQLPFTPFLPLNNSKLVGQAGALDKQQLLGRMKVNKERISVFRKLELLIIDEISMVRCDLLDSIDTVLRHYRQQHQKPFGGVQVLLIGDMFQLPPVAKQEEWSVLSQVYNSPYFFDSLVIKESDPACIELNKIYRQDDEVFIGLLNKVRNNLMDEFGFELLQEIYDPSFNALAQKGFITLTTHNAKADTINQEQLQRNNSETIQFKAIISGDFGEKAYPADEVLALKKGAQVMFIKNDTDKAKRFFNGKIGTINFITKDEIFVQCEGESDSIKVPLFKWDNIKYNVNPTNQKVEEEVIGSFSQFPLRLAWAITIHKSQGLTFDKAVIDAGNAFAPGQVYVALSRCRTLQGIKLLSKIGNTSLFSDPQIVQFSKTYQKALLPENIIEDKRDFQETILTQLFDYKKALLNLEELQELYNNQKTSFNDVTTLFLQQLKEQINIIQEVAQKFQNQLKQLFIGKNLPEENPVLQERIVKAVLYFVPVLQKVETFIQSCPTTTDSKANAKEFNNSLKEIFASINLQIHLLKCCSQSFSLSNYLQAKQIFTLPPFGINVYATSAVNFTSNIPHASLIRALRDLRNELAITNNLDIYLIAQAKTIDEMVTYLPLTLEHLKLINGFGDIKIKNYGEQFLDVLIDYCHENNLETKIHLKEPKEKKTKVEKTNTSLESFTLFKEGKTVAQIATARNLAISTIEGHLSKYIVTGELKIEQLLSLKKIATIEKALENFDKDKGTTPIKELLGDNFTYSEIRFVLLWQDYKKTLLPTEKTQLYNGFFKSG